MDAEEIRLYLDVSIAHSVVVDVEETAGAPGTLRTITFHQGLGVTIEFERCIDYVDGSIEGGGLKYVAQYEDLATMIADIEEYLGRPVSTWSNFTADPYVPKVLHEPSWEANLQFFEALVREKRMPLPRRGRFELAGIYWRHIARYGRYRPDRLGDEDW